MAARTTIGRTTLIRSDSRGQAHCQRSTWPHRSWLRPRACRRHPRREDLRRHTCIPGPRETARDRCRFRRTRGGPTIGERRGRGPQDCAIAMAHRTRGSDNRQPGHKDRPCPTAPTNMAMASPSRCPRPVGSSWRWTSWATLRNSVSCIRFWRNASVRIRRGPRSARFCFVDGRSIGQAASSVLAVASQFQGKSPVRGARPGGR